MRPSINTYPTYFNTYIKLVLEDDLMSAFTNQELSATRFFRQISEADSTYKYAEKKWTIKEILQHISDAERIFTYRALAFARKEKMALPTFDENIYATNSDANSKSWEALIEEFISVRKSSENLFKFFSPEQLKRSGQVSDYTISVLALGYTIIGHAAHHINIITERYLDI
ncbi:MAG: DinB family protein [Ginsengibacter sp.]